MPSVRSLFIFFLTFGSLCSSSVWANEEGGGLTSHAPIISPDWFPLPITNSMVMVWIAALIIIVFVQIATRKMSLIPSRLQNFLEWIVESLYTFLEGILGKHLTKRTFWFFATIFIFILTVNWIGLIPGIGTIGWDVDTHHHVHHPLLRGGNADLNMTAAMSLIFSILWFYWAISEHGFKGFLSHIFAPKGSFKGLVLIPIGMIFFFVGLIEVASILLRPVALSFRLYGNIFAGENVLEGVSSAAPAYLSWLVTLPFYFLEILVGFVQALVFMLLTAVFLKLICEHSEETHQPKELSKE